METTTNKLLPRTSVTSTTANIDNKLDRVIVAMKWRVMTGKKTREALAESFLKGNRQALSLIEGLDSGPAQTIHEASLAEFVLVVIDDAAVKGDDDAGGVCDGNTFNAVMKFLDDELRRWRPMRSTSQFLAASNDERYGAVRAIIEAVQRA